MQRPRKRTGPAINVYQPSEKASRCEGPQKFELKDECSKISRFFLSWTWEQTGKFYASQEPVRRAEQRRERLTPEGLSGFDHEYLEGPISSAHIKFMLVWLHMKWPFHRYITGTANESIQHTSQFVLSWKIDHIHRFKRVDFKLRKVCGSLWWRVRKILFMDGTIFINIYQPSGKVSRCEGPQKFELRDECNKVSRFLLAWPWEETGNIYASQEPVRRAEQISYLCTWRARRMSIGRDEVLGLQEAYGAKERLWRNWIWDDQLVCQCDVYCMTRRGNVQGDACKERCAKVAARLLWDGSSHILHFVCFTTVPWAFLLDLLCLYAVSPLYWCSIKREGSLLT